MEKLANISQFESLMNGSFQAVNNAFNPFKKIADGIRELGYKGGRYIQGKVLADPSTGKKGNMKNYLAAKELERRFFIEKADELSRITGEEAKREIPVCIRKGFDLFARYCYNFTEDMSAQIKSINIETENSPIWGSAFAHYNKVFWGPLGGVGEGELPPLREKERRMFINDWAHELVHLLDNNPAYHKAFSPRYIPGRFTPEYNGPPDHSWINVMPRDRIRSWLYGDPYFARVYGPNDTDPLKFETEVVRYEKPEDAKEDWWKEVLRSPETKKLIKSMVKKGGASEYDPGFMSEAYPGGKVPFFYALDILRMIHKANKIARKQQNGKIS